MHRKTPAVALLLLAAALAGCADGDSGKPADDVPSSTQKVEVTKTTGAIRGIVFDEAITPLEGVRVVLGGVAQETVTAEDGGFVFNGLEPGDYFLSATKPGFAPIQASSSVQAGVEEPPLVKILLARDLEALAAYAVTEVWNGFTQCAVSVTAVFAQACGPLDDRFIHYFELETVPTYFQAEMHWKSSQALTPKLQLNFYKSGTTDWKSVAGASPLFLNATGKELVTARGEDVDQNPMRVSPPYIQCSGGLLANPTSCDPQTVAIVNVNQAYDVFVTHFYGFTPREGWLYAVDGECATPAHCS